MKTKWRTMVYCVALSALACAPAAQETRGAGRIAGRISPADASVRIVAKLAGSEHRIQENIKGEVVLERGGAFEIGGLPAGTYDLLFFPIGDSEKRYVATRWSEISVAAGKRTSGIDYRLTPAGSPYLIDEVVVGFAGTSDADARTALAKAGVVVKDAPIDLGHVALYTVDIPDERSVEDMIGILRKTKGVDFVEPNGISSGD